MDIPVFYSESKNINKEKEMKKFALLVLVVVLASLFISAPAVAQSDKMVVVARLDNVVKVFYLSNGDHHLLSFDGKEYIQIGSVSGWTNREMEKVGAWGTWSGRYRLFTKILPSTTGKSYAEVVRTTDNRAGVRIYISDTDVFDGSSSRKRVAKNHYQDEVVEVVK